MLAVEHVVARDGVLPVAHQRELAERFGADVVLPHEPAGTIVERVGEETGAQVLRPWFGLPWLYGGGIDVVYDTVGAPETLEVALRVLRARGTHVQMGLSSMARCEWTPWYFKECRLVGSNAFGIEEVEGVRQHAIAHYLDLVRDGRIDLRPMLTHRFPLEEWQAAFYTIAMQGTTGAIKVAITP